MNEEKFQEMIEGIQAERDREFEALVSYLRGNIQPSNEELYKLIEKKECACKLVVGKYGSVSTLECSSCRKTKKK